MKKKRLINKILILNAIIITVFFVGTSKSFALEDVENYSELYKQYLELSDEEKQKVNVVPEKYNDTLKEYNENNAKLLKKSNSNSLPKRYNLAEHYNIKVENQGKEGTCWTFASLETLETYLQIHGYGVFDFSENHLNYVESNLFSETQASRKINTAGNYNEFKEYVNKKFGPVSEENYPYYVDASSSIHKEYSQEELNNLLNNNPIAYVGEYISFPSVNKENNQYSDSELLEYRKTIKNHIMENGAIFTLIIAPNYYKGEYYNEDTYAAYFPTTNDYRFLENYHAVAIIGWDDDYSKENFIEENRPEHDGAYIALNSWGRGFGEDGIYYISYDDAFVEQNLHGIKEAATDISELKNTKTITFKDKNLYNAIKNAIEKEILSSDDKTLQIKILNGKINEITSLDIVNYEITDLSGIEDFTSLYSLNISHNGLSNIEPLLSLHNLQDLDLSYNNFTKIPEELNNAELDSLNLSYNPIKDFSGIKNVKSIMRLNLEGTKIKESDLNYLKNLGIIDLNLSKTDIKDYSILRTLNDELEDEFRDLNIQQLNLSYNENIIYSSLPNACFLILSHTNIDEEKFNQIKDTSKLDALDISYTNIKDLNILSGKNIKTIYISGNKDLKNIDVLKNTGFIVYEDAEIKDISIFDGFYCSQLNLAQNEIEDYKALLNLEYLSFVDLSNNKISETYYSDNVRLFLDGNMIKPEANYFENIESMKNQSYTQTIIVDPTRDNIFKEIGENLGNLYNSGTKFKIINGSMNYTNNEFKIDDYNKDVIIKIENGIYEGSTITYKIEKNDNISIYYIYIDRTNLKTTYIEGENFDASGLKVYAVYDNDSICQIDDFTITGGENLKVGTSQIKVEKDGLVNFIEVNAISNDSLLTLNFENTDIYNATLKKINEIEKERRQYPQYYNNLKVLIDKDDENKKIRILKDDLMYISFIEIQTEEAISLEDLKQLKYLSGISIDGTNIEDLSVLLFFKDILDNTEDLLPYERFLSLQIKNNKKINNLENDIYRSLVVENSKLKDLNNLSNLAYLNYKGSNLPGMGNILNSLRMIIIDVTENIEDMPKDENSNIILPSLIKDLKNKGLEIEANTCDQVRDEQYLNSYSKEKINIIESNENLIIKHDDIKQIDYEGSNQFIEIRVKDIYNKYVDISFKYHIKYKIFDHIEVENVEALEVEEDTIPDLSNIKVYKVYSNKERIETTDFTYNTEKVTKDLKEIEISYLEDGKISKVNIPIIVLPHTHKWDEWTITKEPTVNEEGQKERICLKNDDHKEVVKIDKLAEDSTECKTKIIPETGDNIIVYLIIFFVSIAGFAIIIIINKKKFE